jgi:hypothetical protein
MKEEMDLVQLKSGDIKELREQLHLAQDGICPIMKHYFELDAVVLDHIHKQKRADEPGVNGAGLVRGCINRFANIILGKIENSWKRTQLCNQDYITLPQVLRNMADYLERENLNYIHPKEKIPEKKLMKSSYNSLIKLMKLSGYKKKIPAYPTRKKLSKELDALYKKFDLTPLFY